MFEEGNSRDYSAYNLSEMNMERARILVRRWGIIARPLLERESPALGWQALLPALKRLELRGELVEGRFIEGLESMQFAPPGIERELEAAGDETGSYWFNACDPVNTGELTAGDSPARLPSTRLLYCGTGQAAVAQKNGKELLVRLPAADARLPALLKTLTRGLAVKGRLTTETVNGLPAARSPFRVALEGAGFVADRNGMTLWV
jgi:ATP-dependent Lhr-like helicase